MAAESGRKGPPLKEELARHPYRFDFFQAVRVLERMAQESVDRRKPVGQDHPPRREAVRFVAQPSLTFPSGPIAQFQPSEFPPTPLPPTGGESQGAGPPTMTVAHLGLTGPSGVLPQHYTALLIRRLREKDYSLRDFFDVFNHRLVSLFYRAWEKYRYPIGYERSQWDEAGPREDLFTWCLYCLIGQGTPGLRGRFDFDDEALLYYAGHYAHHPRSAIGLEMVLADYFELPTEIRQLQGQWLYLSPDDQTSLPPRRVNGNGSHPADAKQLGNTVVLGARVWDVQSKFRIRLGPIGYKQFRRFMPSGDALRPMAQMTRTYVGPQFDFDVQPVLKADEVPRCRLGGDRADPSRLGWNTWVRSRPFPRDAENAVFSLEG
jgi:type VI secretion system protein ImpH